MFVEKIGRQNMNKSQVVIHACNPSFWEVGAGG
jgi:hypothetical protein